MNSGLGWLVESVLVGHFLFEDWSKNTTLSCPDENHGKDVARRTDRLEFDVSSKLSIHIKIVLSAIKVSFV